MLKYLFIIFEFYLLAISYLIAKLLANCFHAINSLYREIEVSHTIGQKI